MPAADRRGVAGPGLNGTARPDPA
ncbi:hypothetical protein IHE44_0003108 [Lamprotornis superbus]|uniref:Uncharacterized protein n=1 Tax=Lamprotornis superbus TaxID=245042 RepID=A0A835NWZ6_9PASS|nr:hypothetical protein IHE44_0003108 [Lamprotornis superbus]